MTQQKTKEVTLNQIMRQAAFRVGVADFKADRWTESWDLPRGTPTITPDNSYEWGRNFALMYPHWSVEALRPAYGRVNEVAQYDFWDMIQSGAVVK